MSSSPTKPNGIPAGYYTIDRAAELVDRNPQSVASAVRYEKIPSVRKADGEYLVRLEDVQAWSDAAPRHVHKRRFTRITIASGNEVPLIGEPTPAPPAPVQAVLPEPPIESAEIDAKAFLEATRLSAEALVEISATLKVIADALRRERKEF
jgi:hypothetical protein